METTELAFCPKCKKELIQHTGECPFCKIVFNKYLSRIDQTPDSHRSRKDPNLNYIHPLWKKLKANFHNKKIHEDFVSFSIQNRIIPEAIACYNWVIKYPNLFSEQEILFARESLNQLKQISEILKTTTYKQKSDKPKALTAKKCIFLLLLVFLITVLPLLTVKGISIVPMFTLAFFIVVLGYLFKSWQKVSKPRKDNNIFTTNKTP